MFGAKLIDTLMYRQITLICPGDAIKHIIAFLPVSQSNVELIVFASASKRNIGPGPVGRCIHQGVRGVYGGALGTVDSGRVPKLHRFLYVPGGEGYFPTILDVLCGDSSVIVQVGDAPKVTVFHEILTTINNESAGVLPGHDSIPDVRARGIMQRYRTCTSAHLAVLDRVSLRQIIQSGDGLVGGSDHDRLLPSVHISAIFAENIFNHRIRITSHDTVIILIPLKRFIRSNQGRFTQRECGRCFLRVLKPKELVQMHGPDLPIHQAQRAAGADR